MKSVIVLTSIVLLLQHSTAWSTMPQLTREPSKKTEKSCKKWALAQKNSDDAYYLWGIMPDGNSSDEVAYARLFNYCLTGERPEIVGFGSSAGFDQLYCENHKDQKICADYQ